MEPQKINTTFTESMRLEEVYIQTHGGYQEYEVGVKKTIVDKEIGSFFFIRNKETGGYLLQVAQKETGWKKIVHFNEDCWDEIKVNGTNITNDEFLNFMNSSWGEGIRVTPYKTKLVIDSV